MDPLDHLPAGLDGTRCAVCDGPVPGGSTQVLAHRDGLAFLQLDCPDCGSTTLAFVDDGASQAAAGPQPAADPVSPDDVLDMHAFLEGWHGGLAELLAPARAPGSDLR